MRRGRACAGEFTRILHTSDTLLLESRPPRVV